MKYFYLSILLAGFLTACGGEEGSSDSEETVADETIDEFTPPECPSSEITLTFNEYSMESGEIENSDYSFSVLGTAGSYYNNRLDFILGDAENDGMDMYDYLDTCAVCVQIVLNSAAVGDYDVVELSVPVQPYVDGRSKSIFGTSSNFPDSETQGTLSITELSEEWVCGSVDITAYHGGVVKGDFSVELQPKY